METKNKELAEYCMYCNGNIFTSDEENPYADAMLVQTERFNGSERRNRHLPQSVKSMIWKAPV